MITTTIDLYRTTLDGCKKESTAPLTIPKFNRLIAEAQEIWSRSKVQDVEFSKKRIEDLQMLRVVTDGVNGNPSTISPVATNKFPLPVSLTVGDEVYPDFLRLQSVSFKIAYSGNDCNTGTSDWLGAKILRSDSRSSILRNPYRKPKDNRLYYEIIDNNIILTTGTASTGSSMRLDYLRKPVTIFLDVDVNGVMMADLPNPNYTAHTGSVNCEFNEFQRQEIVDIAVRIYLERVQDPRYKSFLQEEMIKSQSK